MGSHDPGRGDSETSLELVGSSDVSAFQVSSEALVAFQAAIESGVHSSSKGVRI